MADRQGIDVSRWQGDINWGKVAKAKDFAIIRCTSGKSNALDSKYPANIKGATAQGLPVGVYRYGYATTVAAAKAEAAAVLDAIDGYDMPCGVWYDVEDASQRKLKGATLTAIIKAFCEAITAGGYQAGIYCNQDWYDNVLDTDALAEYPFWIARYGSNDGKMHTKPKIDGELGLAVHLQGQGLRYLGQCGFGRDVCRLCQWSGDGRRLIQYHYQQALQRLWRPGGQYADGLRPELCQELRRAVHHHRRPPPACRGRDVQAVHHRPARGHCGEMLRLLHQTGGRHGVAVCCGDRRRRQVYGVLFQALSEEGVRIGRRELREVSGGLSFRTFPDSEIAD